MKKTTTDIINGKIFSGLFMYTLPIILTGILQLFFSAADVIVVGRFAGSNSLAAVGSTTSLTHLFVNLFIGLSAGTSVCIAHYTGADDKVSMQKSVHTSIALSLIAGFFIMFVGILITKPILTLMNTPADILNEASLYMKIIFTGMPVMLLYNYGAAIIRAHGDTKSPLIYLTISGILNVILNLITVINFKMGAAGVGIATVSSQLLSAILIVRHLMRSDSDIKLNLKKLKIDRYILFRILKIGVPAGIQGMIFSISNILIQSSINSFGSIAVAGNSASSNIEGFAYTAMNSTSQAMITYVGQNLGAKKFDRLKTILATGCIQVVLIGVISSSILLVFSSSLISLYAPGNTEVLSFGLKRMFIILPTYFLCGLMEVFVGYIRGLGESVRTMFISIFGICVIRIIWVYTVFRYFNSLESLYLSYPFTWALTAAAQFIYLKLLLNKTIKINNN